jgi:hypothetical protein
VGELGFAKGLEDRDLRTCVMIEGAAGEWNGIIVASAILYWRG